MVDEWCCDPELLCIDYTKLTSMGVGINLFENAINNNNVS